MARAKPRPPGTARAIAAYNCGARMAEWQDPKVANMVCLGESIADLMTNAERLAFSLSRPALWWRYWWQGFHYGSTERR